MNYTCLGDNEYEVTLTIFRDCFLGDPGAWFDDPAIIGIYNNGNLIDSLLIPLMGNDTLDPVLANECLVVPPNVCVHTTTYRANVTFPFLAGGYDLIYQRCCRNSTIANIIDPLSAGATYGISLSEATLNQCNNNAKFKEWPPIYICVNEPINFDQSATDIDGDSIVYRLCAPLLGGTPGIPRPFPFQHTIPSPVIWNDPPYSLDDMLGGIPLAIDPNTGLLTGIPNTVGQFVVGICLDEYRDGELISTTSRDFQYNVGVCGQAVSSFFAPDIQCDGFTVEFLNESENADAYEWYFNDPLNPNATSTLPSPSYTYADTGLYTIMLIAEPGQFCVDTSYQQVYLQYESLFADFDYEFTECSDSLIIEVTDLSYDTIFSPSEWYWELSDGQISEEENPTFIVSASQDLILTLTVTATNGCQQTLTQTFEANLIDDVELVVDSISICFGDAINLNPNPNASYTYEWSPPETLNNPNLPNPTATPIETTTYQVTVTDVDNFCQIEREVTVVVPEPIVINVPNDTSICTTDVELLVSANVPVDYTWSDVSDFSTTIGNDSAIVVTPLGEVTYYVQAIDSFNCLQRDSVTITGNGINIIKEEVTLVCDGDSTELSVMNTDPVDELTYSWTPVDLVLSGGDTPTPTVQAPEPGTYTYYVEMMNQFGCIKIDSVYLGVLDTTPQLDFVGLTQCSGYSVNFENTSINADYYLWNFGDPFNPTASSTETNPSYVYQAAGTYNVMLTIDGDVPCKDTIFKEIVVEEPQIVVEYEWEYESCTDEIVINFTDLSTNTQSTITDWLWEFSNGINSEEQNPTITITESQVLDVELTILSDDGCEDVLAVSLPIEIIDITLEDSLAICQDEPINLNPDGNTNYTYSWSPSEGLDQTDIPNPTANPTTTTTYTALITSISADTCTITQEVIVTVPPIINLSVTNDTVICSSEVALQAYSPEAVSYEWFDSEQLLNPISSEPSVDVETQFENTYFVQVTDVFGCTKIEDVFVQNFGINIAVDNEITICKDDSIRILVINSFPNQELTYDWSPEAGIIADGDTNNPLVSPQESTVYGVNVTNQYGCTTSELINISVEDFQPPLTATAEPDTIYLGESAQLLATEDIDYTYTWSPDSTLNANNVFNPIATPSLTSTYNVSIEDANGCTNRDEITVFVLNPNCDEPYIFVPNIFTPNGDGVNDVFYVRGPIIDELYLAVYNRWGEKVFETTDPNMGWDGSYKNKALNSDAFGYYLTVKCTNGSEYFKKGNVTLVR